MKVILTSESMSYAENKQHIILYEYTDIKYKYQVHEHSHYKSSLRRDLTWRPLRVT